MKAHKHIKDSHTPAREPTTWRYYLVVGLLALGMLGLLLIPSCMQAQSKEVTTVSKGEKHVS
uniref:hypothetical protein n=1 Tax=Psychrobacter sp. TaxID=56811 RepID=UPI0015EEDE2A|nr:hypothetical protein [Psychrobacter sp.]